MPSAWRRRAEAARERLTALEEHGRAGCLTGPSMGPSPRGCSGSTCGNDRDEHLGAKIPESCALIGLPCSLDILNGTTLTRRAVGCPSPELRANWDWHPARARRLESAGQRAQMGF